MSKNDPKIERLVEVRLALVKEGHVNGYNTTVEYEKKLTAIDAQMKRVEAAKGKPEKDE